MYLRANDAVLNIEVRGRGEPVVLISDIGEDLTTWCLQAFSFSSLHFMMFLDNRGSGWSDGPPPGFSVPAMAKDVIALMDLVGIERSHIVGSGLGGMVAQEIAIQRPGRVNGLVLASTSSWTSPEQTRIYSAWTEAGQEGGDRRAVSELMVRWLFSDRFLENDQWREHVIRSKAASYQWLSWEGMERQLAAMAAYDSRDRLSAITSPTLVISGEDDRLVPTDSAGELAQGIRGAGRAILKAGHLAHMEMPKTFNRTVLGFLSGIEKG